MKLATAAQMREADRIAIEERGIPSALLMEQAAQALVKEILALPYRKQPGFSWQNNEEAQPSSGDDVYYRGKQQRSVIAFCGPGNNGGDGVAAVRLLLREGWHVKCVLVGERGKMTDDCKEMERRLEESGGEVEDYNPDCWYEYHGFDVAIDALFGTGLNSELRGDAAEAVRLMRTCNWVVSADVPSGIRADTGEVLGHAVQADMTVTFSMGKPGLFVGEGAVHSGRIVVADIGIPDDLMEELDETCMTEVAEPPVFRRRRRNAHKGDFGKLFILAGSRGYTGAPVLAARSAARGGAGLVTLAVPEDIYPIVAVKCDETMPWPLPESYDEILQKASGNDAVLMGPGLGQEEKTEELVLRLLRDLKCPVILDADGINILSRHMDVLEERKALTIITPHAGEFARLNGAVPAADRISEARRFAEKYHCILVMKGYRTITAFWDGKCRINMTGNPGMACGGSGDALAGLMGGFLVQNKDVGAVADAVWIHGRAGDMAAKDKGERGMIVSDLIEQLPYAMKECEEV